MTIEERKEEQAAWKSALVENKKALARALKANDFKLCIEISERLKSIQYNID